jgi:toxin ParE1/3/4
MSLTIQLYPKAQQDIETIVDYLKQENPQSAQNFIQYLQESLDTLSLFPKLGHLRDYQHPTLKQIRMLPIKRFSNYLIFYQPNETTLQVVRVLHASRDIAQLFSIDIDD